MRLGILDLLGLVTTLAFALPVANFGVLQLWAGNPVAGVALLAVAVAMVVVPQYLLDPKRLLMRLLHGLVPKRLRTTDTQREHEQPEK
jgi:hypothetical protein